jgi:hypothetical protein
MTYYKFFVSSNAEVFGFVHEYLPHLDLSTLHIDGANKTLYIDPEVKERIGVFCYYVDKDRKPLRKDIDALVAESSGVSKNE